MAVNHTVIAYSRVRWYTGNKFYIQVLFDGGLTTTANFIDAYGVSQPTNGQNICNLKDITGDIYSDPPTGQINNLHWGGYGTSAFYLTDRITRVVDYDCHCGVAGMNGPFHVSGERTYQYELAEDPGVTHSITVWVPGRDALLDREGQLPEHFQQCRMPRWNYNAGYLAAYDAALPGHKFSPNIYVEDHVMSLATMGTQFSDQTEGFEFIFHVESDPHNRFYGDTLFTGGIVHHHSSFYVPIEFGTDALKTNYVADGSLSSPTPTDCTLPNPSTTSTGLKGIVCYDKYQHWLTAKTNAANYNTSLYDEFVSIMATPNIHTTGYVPSQILTLGTDLKDVVPTLGGWAMQSHQVSETPSTVPGCMDTLAENYSNTYTSDCADENSASNNVNPWISPGNISCCWYCADPTATNYNSNAALNCDGTTVGTTAGGWNDCCEYNTAVYGCTDPLATNYNAAATVDDGSCSYVSTNNCQYSWSDECNNQGSADVTVDLLGGSDLKNITTTYNSITTVQSTCTAPANIVLPLITTPGGTIDIEGECSFTLVDTYDPNINAVANGGQQPPLPPWAQNNCGELVETNTTTTFASDTDVYVWYDTSSWGTSEVISAYNAVEDWLAIQTTAINWSGNVYHILFTHELFLDVARYPMTGQCNIQGGSTVQACTPSTGNVFSKHYNFAKCAAWVTYHNVPNWYHTANTLLKEATGTIAVGFDVDGSVMSTGPGAVDVTMINNAICMYNNGVGYTGPDSFAGIGNNGLCALPPIQAAGGNFLNVIFLDEATDYNTGSTANSNTGAKYGNPPGPGGYTHSSVTNQSSDSSWRTQLQVKPQYIIDYDNYVTSWKGWSGSGRTFIYPTAPAGMTNQHYGSAQLIAATVFSGNKATPDGHFSNGTANTLHPVQGTNMGLITLFEDGTQGARHNVFWDKANTLHPDYGYGGLDNYGWGANVEMSLGGFTSQTFSTDLDTFIATGPPITTTTTTATCNDSECVLFVVKDQNGNPLSGYELKADGVSIGTTDVNGELVYTITLASTVPDKLINNCWTLDPVGNCFQRKFELVVAKDSYTTNIACLGGCTDPLALNYNPLATWDDGSCLYCIWGCMNPAASNYDPLATCDDGCCIIEGCTNVWATNYDPAANIDDGSCVFPGDNNDCVPDNIYYDMVNTTNCIAKFSTRYYKKLITGMEDDCSTLLIWQLTFINYLLPKFELDCFYNCADIGTPDASSSNQGGNSTDNTNYLDKFRTFVAKHCEDCFKENCVNTVDDDISKSPQTPIGSGGNDDGMPRESSGSGQGK